MLTSCSVLCKGLLELSFNYRTTVGYDRSFVAQVQRLQRYATYGHLKQLVLRLIADDVVALSEEMSDKVLALRSGFLETLQCPEVLVRAAQEIGAKHNSSSETKYLRRYPLSTQTH